MAVSSNRLSLAEHHRPIRSFVRREGRLTPAQQRALQDLLPRFRIDTSTRPLNLQAIFNNKRPVVLEIGFGNGTLLAQQAKQHPEINFIGIEVHRPGVGRLLQQLDRQDIENVRVMDTDAIEVLENLIAAKSLLAIWLYFPDPWPKKRHHKRRIVDQHFLDLAASALQGGGLLHMATDWQDYADHMLDEIRAHPAFQAIQAPDRANYPFDRPLTHFEQRGQKKGHGITDLYAQSCQ